MAGGMRARALDVAVRANTGHFESGMRTVSRALKSTIIGINAVAGAAAGTEKSFIGMVNAVAIGFASGGPWGAAIATAGVGIGLLIGEFKKLRAETDKAAEAQAKFFAELDKMSNKSRDMVTELEFVLKNNRKPQPEEIRLEQIAVSRKRTQGALDRQTWDWANLSEQFNTEQRLKAHLERLDQEEAALRESLKVSNDLDAAYQRIADNERAAADAAEKWREELERIPMSVQVAADSVFALLDGILVRGMKAKDVLRSVAMNIASIGLRVGVNSAFGLSTP